MAIRKIGENLTFSVEDCILTPRQALHDRKIAARFIKLAKKLRRIAPKAEDFLYGHAVMMHAAEACLVDQETGEIVTDNKGNPVTASFEPYKLSNGKESVKWKCSKKDLMPYKNANGDIFPESELLKAHRKWIGKPLCKDHKSESVDGIRGIIIDTYYDPKFKRVHVLFALDRKNYGDLARKVETGYANCVSMGTAVGCSICTECGNPAATEREYCKCIRSKSNYGEINLDLNPIELSLVVNGADGRARIRNIIASMNTYVQKKQVRIEELTADRCVNPTELQAIADTISDMQIKIKGLMYIEAENEDLGALVGALKELKDDPEMAKELKSRIMALLQSQNQPEELQLAEDTEQIEEKIWPPMRPGPGGPSVSSMSDEDTAQPAPGSLNPSSRLASKKEGDKQGAFSKELRLLRSNIERMQNSLSELNQKVSKGENNMNSARLRARAKARRAYWLGGGGVNEPTPGKEKYPKEEADKIRDNEDKQMTGQPLETGSEGLHPGDAEKLRDAGRDGLNLSKAELKDRAMKRRAYWLGGGGVNEPSPGKYPYDKDGMAEQVRNNEDKHLQGIYEMGGKDGTVPGDMEIKKKLLRARLRAKFTKVADESGSLRKDASRWDVYAGDKLVLSATGAEIYGDELGENWDYLSSKEYGKDVIKYIRTDGFDRVVYLLKGAQPPAGPAAGVDPLAGGADPLAAPEGEGVAPEAAPIKEPKEEEGLKGKVDVALGKMEESIEEIRTAVTEGGDKLVDIEVKVDEGVGKDGEEAAPSPMEGVLSSLRNEALEAHALMNESADELALISEALEEGSSDRLVRAAIQALEDSDVVFVQAATVLAKKKKDDDEEDEDEKEDKEKKEDKDKKKEAAKKKDDDDKKKEKDDEEDDDKKDKKEKKAQKLLDDALRIRSENRAALISKADDEPKKCPTCKGVQKECECDAADDAMLADMDEALAEDCIGDDCFDADDVDFVLESEESVTAARKAAREDLIAQAADKILGKYELGLDKAQNATEKTYFDAHPGGKGTVTELSHTKTDEAKVETISEIHSIMRDVAESGPRNVREAAMMIQEEMVKGALTVGDLDRLVAEGKVDGAAASYWKKFWSQGPDTGSFGADLSKEFSSRKKEASNKHYEVKLRRAYDLGLQAQEKGMIGSNRNALDTYVDEVMHFDDAAFESTKRIMAGVSGSKKSGSLPIVGADAATEAMNVTASVEMAQVPVLSDQLGGLGWK